MPRLVAAGPDAQRARDRLTFAAWGRGLAPEAFAWREERLRAHPFAAAGLETWLLCDDDDVGGRAPLASLETCRMQSRIGTGPETAFEPRASFGIANVFVEERLRGRGYASALVAAVLAHLARIEPGLHAALLFSDVGPALYARQGFVIRPAEDLVLPAAAGDPADGIDALLGPGELAAALSALTPPAAPFLIWPTVHQLDWHLERERLWAHLLGRAPLPACGARAGAGSILWAASFRKRALEVLLFMAERPAEQAALARAARRMAAAAGLDEVRIWAGGLSGAAAAPPPDAARVARSASLPMIRPLAAAVRAEDFVFIPRALWL